MNGIEQLLTSNIASIVMAGGFIYYLIIKDKSSKATFEMFNKCLERFNRTLTNHLTHQLKAELELSRSFSNLSTLIGQLIKESKKK